MKKYGLMTMALAGALSLGSALAQGQTIKIATLTPLSGGQSDLGVQIRQGTELAINEYRDQFKKLGFDLQVVGYDDQADPATGTANALKIAADKNILAVVGTLNSGVAMPVSEKLAPYHLAMVSPANTKNELTERGLKNFNRIVARDDAQGPAGARFIKDNLKAKKVYILNDKTAYGEGLAKEVEKFLKANNVQVVQNEGTEEKSDFSAIISKIQLTKPDAVYFGGIYNQTGVFAKQLREKGVTVPLVGGDGFDSGELLTIAGPRGSQNIYFTTVAAPIGALPAAKTFAQNFKKTFNEEAQGFGAFGYDAAQVVLQGTLDAIKANNGKAPTREQVEKAIRNVKATNLLSGNVQFNSAGDRQKTKLYVMKVQDGKFGLETTVDVTAPKK